MVKFSQELLRLSGLNKDLLQLERELSGRVIYVAQIAGQIVSIIHGSPGTEIPGIGTEIGVFGHV